MRADKATANIYFMSFFTTEEFLAFMKREVKTAVEEALVSAKQAQTATLGIHAKYLTRHQVAEYLGIGLSTVDHWTRIGRLKKIFIDNAPRFDREEIDRKFSPGKRKLRKAA